MHNRHKTLGIYSWNRCLFHKTRLVLSKNIS